MSEKTNRREFEEWAMSQDVSMFTFKNRKGKYADPITQTAWEAWQAARDQLTKQRDRLAEVLNLIVSEADRPISLRSCSPAYRAKQALQSLTTNTPDQERKSPASNDSEIK